MEVSAPLFLQGSLQREGEGGKDGCQAATVKSLSPSENLKVMSYGIMISLPQVSGRRDHTCDISETMALKDVIY